MAILIKSKAYIGQYCRLREDDRGFVEEAIGIILSDPGHTLYQRGFLHKYSLRQAHPNGNKQLSIFFEILPNGDVFLRWMNDYSCLHDTRQSYGEDPSMKQLEKFLSSKEHENFEPKKHLPQFAVDPKYGGTPYFIKMELLGMRIFTNPYNNGVEIIAESIGVYDLDDEGREENVHFLDFLKFFKMLRDYLIKTDLTKFSFQLNNELIDEYIVNLAVGAAPQCGWKIKMDHENNFTMIEF